MDLITERLVFSGRPSFEVDGRAEARLTEDLLRLEVRVDERGLAAMELVLLNWGSKEEGRAPDFLYFDGGLVELGKRVRVVAGAPDRRAEIFRGSITAIEGVFPELRPAELVVRAEDELQRLQRRQRTRFLEDVDDGAAAGRVAQEHGLPGDVRAAGQRHEELWQVNQSDLEFLRERARSADAALADEDGTLVFRPRRAAEEAPVALTLANELLSFRVVADLAEQRAEVRVHGWSVADKLAVHGLAGAEAVRAEAAGSGRTGPEWIAELEPHAALDLHLDAPAGEEEARGLAESVMRTRARRFVRGRGLTDGTPGLRVGMRLELAELGPRFSGVYHVAAVRHTFDQRDGFRTHFEAERVDLGEGA